MKGQTTRTLSKNDCFRLMHAMEMMDHIVDHSLTVCHVAVRITDGIIAKGVPVDRELVIASALLHDITKTRSFATGENHAETGDRFLRELGFPEAGRIVGQHVLLVAYAAAAEPSEAEIVNYADKRVLHDRVTSLDERMDYIAARYGKTPDLSQKIQWLWKKTRELEARLFAYLPFSPDELGRSVDAKAVAADRAAYRRCCRTEHPAPDASAHPATV